MFKGSHFIFLSFILLAVVSCSFIPTDETNLALFNVIKQAYNSGTYLIYELKIILDLYINNLTMKSRRY